MSHVRSRPNRAVLAALLVVLVFAGVVRVVGLHRGAPELHADETILVQGAGAALEGVPPDCVLGWPATTQMTILTGVFAADLAVRRGPELLASSSGDRPLGALDDHYAEFYREPDRWFLMFRIVTVLFGLLTVLLAFLIGRRWLGGDLAGLFAAALVATHPVHVSYSHFVLPDVPMVFFWLAAVGLLLAHIERPRARTLFFAPFVAALASMTKFNALPLLLFVTVWAASLPDETGRGIVGRFGVALLGALVGAIVGCPWLLTDGAVLLKDFLWRNFFQQAVAGRPGAGHGGSGWWFLLVRHLGGSYGLAVGLLLLPGLALAAMRRTAAHLAVGGLLLGYLALLGLSSDIHAKWVMPGMPLIALLGGALLTECVGWAARLGRLRHGVLGAAAILVVVSAAASVRYCRTTLEPLPREELLGWVAENVPPGETIASEEYAENPFPLCRAAIEERMDELVTRIRDVGERPDRLPVFFAPALLNEETFELQRLRHLLGGAGDDGYRVLSFGTKDRLERMLEAARDGRAGVFVLQARERYRDARSGREKELRRARRALVKYLEGAAIESAVVGERFRVYRLR